MKQKEGEHFDVSLLRRIERKCGLLDGDFSKEITERALEKSGESLLVSFKAPFSISVGARSDD